MTLVDQNDLSTTGPGDPASFWADGACRHLPADLFHPERGESTKDAKAVCAACTVRIPCLEWALANHEKFGIWGGTSERERRRIRHRIATGLPVPQLDPDHDLGLRLVPPPPPNEPTREEPAVDLAAVAVAVEPIAPTNGQRPVDPDTGRPTDVCVNCGKRYTPARRTQRFHSKACARAWYASHPNSEGGVGATTRRGQGSRPGPLAPRDCETCGQAYDPARKDQRFCSAACRAKHKNALHYRPAADVPDSAITTTGPGIDVQALLGQLLAACDRWAIEADLGDIRVSVTRGCR